MSAGETFRSGHAVIVGRPNVGKSTLLNRLLGQKISITSRKPQTTRHRVLGVANTFRAQCAFVDTPGFQSGRPGGLRGLMNRSVMQALSQVDVIAFVVAAPRFTAEDEQVAALLPAGVPLVVAANKVDLVHDRSALLPYLDGLQRKLNPHAIVPVAARTGYQVDALLAEIERALPLQPPLYPPEQLTDRDERFFAAEFIREKVFRLLGDELPYSTAVSVERFEDTGKLRRIQATIHVDKDSHKAIVIGEGGERLKAIASGARKDMEKLFGGKVYLQVWVKVRRGWADDAAQLRRFGYG